ncbi:hypothetical protein LEP1GSC013_2328 [Leptospira interrogans serovar Valbuzzi str. Duyster]|nr:hypothetical protein LEP1GSC013_2328 [Leptospira interrogans serovar Valbuzzi str. Duyster]ENO71580.1 hypothetical protein LEP1GSC012_0203 [Leptospira interrogans serovar Valbuzzi str. Valbuzzi]
MIHEKSCFVEKKRKIKVIKKFQQFELVSFFTQNQISNLNLE